MDELLDRNDRVERKNSCSASYRVPQRRSKFLYAALTIVVSCFLVISASHFVLSQSGATALAQTPQTPGSRTGPSEESPVVNDDSPVFNRDQQQPAVERPIRPSGLSAIKSIGPFACRTSKYRKSVAGRFGATKETQTAVAAALYWLAKHQMPDGNWSLTKYTEKCVDQTCTGEATEESRSAATALGLLPFLAAGQTHTQNGPFQKTVAKGIDWLVMRKTKMATYQPVRFPKCARMVWQRLPCAKTTD